MARLTLPKSDPSMGVSPTMDPLIAQPSRRPRLVAPTLCRRLPAAVLPALIVALLAAALLAVAVAAPLWAPAARAAGTAPAAAGTTIAAATSTLPDAVIVAPLRYADADPLIAALTRAGARPAIVYLPRAALARVSPVTAARLRALGYAVLRAHGAAPAGASGAVAALAALDRLAGGAATGRLADLPVDLPSLAADLKLSAAASAGHQTSQGLAAPAILGRFATLQTATAPMAYAAGSVVVSIIFPQSTKAAPKHSESWATPDQYGPAGQRNPAYPSLTPREAYIVAEVSKTLLWWQARAPAAAQLTFVIPAAGKLGTPRQVSVAREPIAIASTSDQTWRHPIMAKVLKRAVGAADSPPPERAYDNAVRRANGTDWAFTLYVVDSLHDDATATNDPTPGAFPDGAFAYTYDLFGPYTVTTYDNATYTPGNFDGVLAHEIGHEFGALDEYKAEAGYQSSGALFSGYLWVKNLNAVQGGTTHDACIMRGGDEGLAAYQGEASYKGDVSVDGGICPSTAGQIGWRVTRHGLPDVVDTTPTVTLNKPALDGSAVSVSGVATEHPWAPGHNAKGRAFAKGISILTPHAVQYSVDGGAWTAVASSGGASQSFSFAAALSGQGPDVKAPTRHVVAVQATTGTTATSYLVAWSNPTPVAFRLASSASMIALGGQVRLTVHATDATDPIYAIGFLPGVSIGALSGAAGPHKTVTTTAGGSATVSLAPRFTTTFRATLSGPQPVFMTSGATPVTVTVAVRPLLAAHAGVASARVVRVTGSFRPRRAAVPLLLQARSGSSWRTVARARTTSGAGFSLAFVAPRGTVRLRVRFAGDARNAAATRALPAVTVP
jgi:hypothetical protein